MNFSRNGDNGTVNTIKDAQRNKEINFNGDYSDLFLLLLFLRVSKSSILKWSDSRAPKNLIILF